MIPANNVRKRRMTSTSTIIRKNPLVMDPIPDKPHQITHGDIATKYVHKNIYPQSHPDFVSSESIITAFTTSPLPEPFRLVK